MAIIAIFLKNKAKLTTYIADMLPDRSKWMISYFRGGKRDEWEEIDIKSVRRSLLIYK